jgi:hypothetical protein
VRVIAETRLADYREKGCVRAEVGRTWGVAMIFIDANMYLVLYKVVAGRKLLEAILAQKGNIFVTQQIVYEVERNKLDLARDFFREQGKKIKPDRMQVSDHLFGLDVEVVKQVRERVIARDKAADEVDTFVGELVHKSLDLISKSADDVSRQLSVLFKDAVPPTGDQVAKARWRREIGNPPGKPEDPLGDQLTWEQLLEVSRKDDHLWIVTADTDYLTIHEGKCYLNPLLYAELCDRDKPLNLWCFTEILPALKHYAATAKVEPDKARLPSPEEEKAIEEEWSEVAIPTLVELTTGGGASHEENSADKARKIMRLRAQAKVEKARRESIEESMRHRRK